MKKWFCIFLCLFSWPAFAQFADQRQFATTSGGTPNAQTVAIANYAKNVGVVIRFIPSQSNTGPVQLNINGQGLVNLLQMTNGGGLQPLATGQLIAGQVAQVVYDGVQYEFLNAATNPNMAVNPMNFGARCDGTTTTSDTAGFNAAFAASYYVVLPANVQCLIGNLVVQQGQTLDCSGSKLDSIPGSQWTVKKSGYASIVRHCGINDTHLYTENTSTLSAAASPGATSLSVQSATGFQTNMVLTVQLQSGAYWTTKITGVSGNTITIADPVPYTVTGVTVNSGGSGYSTSTNTGFVINNPAMLGGFSPAGTGAPPTVLLTTVSGAITGVSVLSPGLLQGSLGSTVAVFQPGLPAAFGGVVNVTYGGAPSGGYVDAAFGAYMVDNSAAGVSEDIVVSEAPIGVMIANTSGNNQYTDNESLRHIDVNAATMVGVAKMANTNDNEISEFIVYGYQHHASSYGAAGLYIDGDNQTVASGNTKYDITLLNFEVGVLDNNGTLDEFRHLVSDTNAYYGFICNGCNSSTFNSIFASFTGPLAGQGRGGGGVGMVFGNATNNSLGQITTQSNAVDLHLGDNTSSLWLDHLSWSWTKVITGWTSSLYPGYKLVDLPTIAAPSGASAAYIAPGVISATIGPGVPTNLRGEVTAFFLYGSIAPSTATYTVSLQINRFVATNATYAGWQNYGSCTFTGTTQGCGYFGPGILIFPQDQVALSVISATGGTGTNFPTGQSFLGYIGGL